jgi:CheY-like chemotaxis protein
MILCVDDEDNPLVLRTLVLKKAGYEVMTAKSGAEALQVTARNRAVDMVLSDYLMPGMNGVELARKIKAQRPNLPVILISGVNEIPPEAHFADAFVSKVEGPDILCNKIAAVLRGETIPRPKSSADA